MTDKEWEKFFQLLGKIVQLDGMSFNEKREATNLQAGLHSGDGDLEEFVSWYGGATTCEPTEEVSGQ